MRAWTVETGWRLNELESVILASRRLRVVVLPELGGKIWSVEYRPLAKEWLWHNPRIEPARVPFGVRFDDVWSGGLDIFFPSCYPSSWNGEAVPDAGELWSIPWSHELVRTPDALSLVMRAGGRVWPVRVRRTLELGEDELSFTLGVEVENVGGHPLPFLLGVHPALAVSEGDRIDLPPGTATVAQSSGPALGAVGQVYTWPALPDSEGTVRDLGIIPGPGAHVWGGHEFTPAGPDLWWALRHPPLGVGIGLVAPRERFRGLWMWQAYGGWRGYHHLALEPWTGFPVTLHEAVAGGSASWLAAGETYRTWVRVVAFEGAGPVRGIGADGSIRM